MKRTTLWMMLGLTVLATGWMPNSQAASKETNEAFPLRSRYYRVPIMETDELHRRYDQVIIVDVRSKYEYDTLRVKDALHISVTDRNFIGTVRELREKTSKPIVFYCNGKTCHKSYDAVVLAMNMQIQNVYCYDAGIADWAQAHPERAALFGKSPVPPGALISRDKFQERLLEPTDFESRIGPKTIVVDVRDRAQRDSLLFPGRELRSQLDDHRMLGLVIEKAKQENKTLLVYDQVGKQVEWFQYYLESKGIKDYYFMKGGAQAYFDATLGKSLAVSDKKK